MAQINYTTPPPFFIFGKTAIFHVKTQPWDIPIQGSKNGKIVCVDYKIITERMNTIAKTDRCVVRNQAYRRAEISIRERHNERKNMDYQNPDIITERSHLNVHFKSCVSSLDGRACTYEQEFNRMVESGAISLRGLKPDAKVFDELVFDVNTAYFENHGGYEYAKEFFAEAYRLAVKEVGGEEYVLSAVLHADERNRALSDQLGRDVFHYHLHVVYVPVVDKEIYFKKNNKNPELAGKLREIVKQVSHSKKWPRLKDEQGHWVNSYSLLQDRFFEHMQNAGYTDFERGERGSTAKHLAVMEYKTKKEAERAAALAAVVEQKQDAAAALDKQATQKQKRLDSLEQKTTIAKKDSDVFADIDGMAEKRTITGAVAVPQANWKTLSTLAKEGQKSRATIKELRKQNEAQSREIATQKSKLKEYGEGQSITAAMRFHQAAQRAPERMAAVMADIMRQPPEQQPPTRAKEKNLNQSR